MLDSTRLGPAKIARASPMNDAATYTDEEGELAVHIARDAVDSSVRAKSAKTFQVPERFNEKSGVFVTLNTWPGEELRGCIGFPQPIYPLALAIVKAAESAAREDPRFPPVTSDELDRIVVEVSILTTPELISVKKPRDYVNAVTIGTDGLIVAKGQARGLLLPQVAVDWRWDVQEFLSQTCIKSGLPPDAWLDESTRMYKFRSEIFSEDRPRGQVARRVLGASHAGP